MKRLKLSMVFLSLSMALFFTMTPAKADGIGDTNYRLSLCHQTSDAGTDYLAAQCITPQEDGPCDRQAPCSGWAPAPIIK